MFQFVITASCPFTTLCMFVPWLAAGAVLMPCVPRCAGTVHRGCGEQLALTPLPSCARGDFLQVGSPAHKSEGANEDLCEVWFSWVYLAFVAN